MSDFISLLNILADLQYVEQTPTAIGLGDIASTPIRVALMVCETNVPLDLSRLLASKFIKMSGYFSSSEFISTEIYRESWNILQKVNIFLVNC